MFHLNVFRSLLGDAAKVFTNLEKKFLVLPQFEPRLNGLQELVTKSPQNMVSLVRVASGHRIIFVNVTGVS